MNRNHGREVGTGDKSDYFREKKKEKRERGKKKNNSNLSKDPEMDQEGNFLMDYPSLRWSIHSMIKQAHTKPQTFWLIVEILTTFHTLPSERKN